MSKIIDYLQQLDLSDMEAKFYLKLLETGPISVSELAHAMNTQRPSVYLYIDPLIAKGLVTRHVLGTKKQVAPTQPENLEALIDKKFTTAKFLKDSFPAILQEIKDEFPSFKESDNVEVKYYKGVNNARKIYEEALQANEVRAYARIDPVERLYPDNAAVFEEGFRTNKKLKWWEFIYGSDSAIEVSEQVVSNTDRYFYKFMPKYLKLSSEDILIYDNKVAIINYRGGKTSVVLQSIDFYNNLKELFDFMWDVLAHPEKDHTK